MDRARTIRLLDDLDEDLRTGSDIGERLCRSAVETLSVTGAGIMLMADGQHKGTLGVSNDVMSVVEDLQFTLGEGPCIDAFSSEAPVHAPDIANPAERRWPGFCRQAVDAGVRALFGFPLHVGGASFGALDLYMDRPGDLLPKQAADAIEFADVISGLILSLQGGAAPGMLADPLGARFTHRAVVHQASGMLSAQLVIDVDEALVRIRAHAFGSNRSVHDVASDIVNRHLWLE
ncbi:MAG: GAF and ANTAR domain-containing protein [Euzebya sp.]